MKQRREGGMFLVGYCANARIVRQLGKVISQRLRELLYPLWAHQLIRAKGLRGFCANSEREFAQPFFTGRKPT